MKQSSMKHGCNGEAVCNLVLQKPFRTEAPLLMEIFQQIFKSITATELAEASEPVPQPRGAQHRRGPAARPQGSAGLLHKTHQSCDALASRSSLWLGMAQGLSRPAARPQGSASLLQRMYQFWDLAAACFSLLLSMGQCLTGPAARPHASADLRDQQ